VLNPHIERDETAAYGVSVTPACRGGGTKDYGIRFLGVPAGYEFSNLIDSIIAVSRGEAQLKDETKTAPRRPDRRRHHQGVRPPPPDPTVLGAVRLAQHMSIASDWIPLGVRGGPTSSPSCPSATRSWP